MASLAKFHAVPMGPSPIVATSALPHVATKNILGDSLNHIRRHSGAGVTPPIAAPAKVLGNDKDLFNGATELASLYEKAATDSLANPTATEIKTQTGAFAESMGMTQKVAPKPSMVFATKTSKTPSMK